MIESHNIGFLLISMRSLIRNYSRATKNYIIPNSVFRIEWCDVFNSVYYYDEIDHTNYLFIIHRNGIIKYDLDQKIIIEQYKQFINNEYMTENHCCLNVKENIIYMNLFAEKRIITFNINSKIWNLNFVDYGNINPRPIFCSDLVFVSNSDNIGEVRIELKYFDQNSTIFRMSKNGQLTMLQKMNKKVENETYHYTNRHLYQIQILQTAFRNALMVDLDKMLLILFKKRIDSKMIHYHLAFGQIIFFIFEITGYYIIDCVDILDQNKIYFNIKTIKKNDFDTIFFDRSTTLHHVCITHYMNDQEVHSKILSNTIMPKIIIQNDVERIQKVCCFYSRKNNIVMPTALTGEIIRFSQISC